MKKYALWALILCVSGAVLFGCAQKASNNSTSKSEVADTNEIAMQEENEIVLAEQADAMISITGIEQKNNELVTPLTVHIGDTSKSYPWENVAAPDYYPEVIVTDLDYDNDNEIFIFLVKGFGTGILNSEAHIMKSDFTEITAPNPAKDVKNLLSTEVIEHDGKQIYKIKFNNKKYTFSFNMDEAAMWFEEATVGKITQYRIENNRLIVSQSLQVSPSIFIATIDTSYRLINGQFKLENSVFIETPQETEKTEQETEKTESK